MRQDSNQLNGLCAGVCSWSLRPVSARALAADVAQVGVRCVQLALDPIRENRPGWGEIETQHALAGAGVMIESGMMGTRGEDYSSLESIARTGGVRPDATWGRTFAPPSRTRGWPGGWGSRS